MKKGVTLIEVLVASLILVISVGAILMSYVPRNEIIIENKEKVIAVTSIEKIFELIRGQQTANNIKSVLYRDVAFTKPYSKASPYTKVANGITYSFYYTLFETEPYRLVSLGSDDDPYLKIDEDNFGNEQHFGAKVFEIEVNVDWTSKTGVDKSISIVYRGGDEID